MNLFHYYQLGLIYFPFFLLQFKTVLTAFQIGYVMIVIAEYYMIATKLNTVKLLFNIE